MFENRLVKVYRHLSKQARRLGVSCYRLYDHDLPEFPLCIEIYEENIYVAEYKRRHGMGDGEHEVWIQKTIHVIAGVLGKTPERIHFRLRQRKAGRKGQYQKMDQQKHESVVSENGLKFIVNLSDYLDTGLFLDHRNTRGMVKAECKDKTILNLFAYTGSFSVYAAAGLARLVITVDLSNTYLAWAQRNMLLNGFTDPKKYQYIQADIKQYLAGLNAERFDLIIMDPPTFSNSKRMEEFLDIQEDHGRMINQCLHSLSRGGVLYFSTNYKKFQLNSEVISTSGIQDITRNSTAFDFEGRWTRHCFRITK